jgi:murein DD-endopeptidase MepM/ murein hydrolase activator NlpD
MRAESASWRPHAWARREGVESADMRSRPSPRSLGRLALALVLVAGLLLAPPATAKKRKHRVFHFGDRALSVGAKGKDVRFLQRALTKLGVSTGIDGAFGKGTFQSVKKFERQRTWPVNGRVSRKEAKRIKKLLARPAASGYYLFGLTSPTLTLRSNKAGNAEVKVSDSGGNEVASIAVSFDSAESKDVSWNGALGAGGWAPDGTYTMRLSDPGIAGASVTGGQTAPFALHGHYFPVPGTHSFGGAGSRFGAPRGDHIHQGQDMAAACGEGLYVAEGGTLRVNSYQGSGAGYYIVIHGAISGSDYVYMHMQAPSWAAPNTIVYTAQEIGRVGNTGSSSGCHLHFERWSPPGWYVGGTPYDPLPELLYWDSYS